MPEICKAESRGDLIQVRDAELGLEYEAWGACPVQAHGEWRGREVYFRARHGWWTFEVADHDGILPSDGGRHGGHTWEDVDPHNGFMPLPEVVPIIERCVRSLGE